MDKEDFAPVDSSWDYLFDMAESEPEQEYVPEEIPEYDREYDPVPDYFEERTEEPVHLPETPEEALRTFFGYAAFRSGQREIIDRILQGRDLLAVMPTGAGKSLCYQIPALLLPGLTLVISPLISLMQDQVQALQGAGVPAAYINSSLSELEFYETLDRAERGQVKLLYAAPERLENQRFLQFAKRVSIAMVTVDEAHCISQWGQDFRPSYMKIIEFIQSLEQRPILSAFTATATEIVREDIVCTLGLKDPFVLVTGFDRENLFFQVEKPKDKTQAVLNYIREHPEESGIIYCATRKNVDQLYTLLRAGGIEAARYHAGMSGSERKQMQNDFVYDYKKIVVATNAFGMGIDKSNVRFVIHYNMPQSMENYYQEAGRAGRDGLDSACILLYSPQDLIIQRFLLEHKILADMEPEVQQAVRQRDQQRLQVMEQYCYTTECLRNYILNYFGEQPGQPCENCGNCRREFETVDMTDAAKKMINCVYEARGRFGKNIIIDTLLGAKTARLKEVGADAYQSYGALADSSRSLLLRLVEQLLLEGYLITGSYRVLKLGDIRRLKEADTKVLIKITDEDKAAGNQAQSKKRTGGMSDLTSAGYRLLDQLKAVRLSIAREEHVPPYIVFSDKTLVDMAVKVPTADEEMLQVSGVGAHKMLKYGGQFLNAIRDFAEEEPDLLQRKAEVTADRSEEQPQKARRSRKKLDFHLLPEEAEQYEYREFHLISEIRDEMRRICLREEVKKPTTVMLTEILLTEGYIINSPEKGPYAKDTTELGREKGILTEDRVGQKGTPYTVLKYPEQIQRMLVERFTK
ncbi:MAG: DNA helicase RecQ [Lachnospiraceae bacterium]|nr:DNA helicase RecQ [Lachnospiraceae bacterium]